MMYIVFDICSKHSSWTNFQKGGKKILQRHCLGKRGNLEEELLAYTNIFKNEKLIDFLPICIFPDCQ